nr:bifunctional adenosylcobinamide kinase/adenosylcobinamide-phosphate guanylyltransferase [Chromobacterium vaccinii]
MSHAHLITGGARSGKSRHAEDLARRHGGPVCYLATAEVRDAEFARRVALHRAQRPAHWRVAEAGRGLAAIIAAHDAPGGLLLIDCLGMWLMRFSARPVSMRPSMRPSATRCWRFWTG